MPAEMHRRQLAEFLKSCRARLEPGDVGLPDSKRRRTPGLRREDVAALAGVSVTWYTSLEQGRDIRASADVLEKISKTLRMSMDEREYLFALVQHRPAPLPIDEDERVEPEVASMIDALNVPALIISWRWDILAWNSLAVRVFRDYEKLQVKNRNLLRHILLSPEYQVDPDEFEATVARLLSRFRVDFGQAPNDPRIKELVEDLSAGCELFDKYWMRSEVSNRTHGVNLMRHPTLGKLCFEHSSYVPEGSPKLRMILFVPHDDTTRQRLIELTCGDVTGKKADSLN